MTRGARDRQLVIRADAGPGIGTGHVMRALALGQAWREAGGHVDFVTVNPAEILLARLEKEGFLVHLLPEAHPGTQDWEETARTLAAFEDPWLTLDGYHFDPAYQALVRDAEASSLFIDDMAHLDRYAADILLNQNAHAGSLDYRHPPETRLLLGLDYVLLRQEFQPDARPDPEIPKTARRVLVTFGGVDPLHLTEKSVDALNRLDAPGLEAVVIATRDNGERASLKAAVEESRHDIRLEDSVSEMTRWMEWADLAVCSGGTTVWELAFMGVPSLVIATSPPERLLVQGLDEVGLFESWKRGEEVNPSALAFRMKNLMRDAAWRGEMSARGQRLVDGRGRNRVIAAMVGTEGAD